jgi:hypothetical protein
VVYLPWQEICGTGTANFGYHLTSDVPVTVYQFNPLDSALPATRASGSGTSCTSDGQCQIGDSCATSGPTAGQCTRYSFSNDASLLLPTHLLGNDYVVIAADEESVSSLSGGTLLPGAMSVVATQDNTSVTIHVAGSVLSTSSSRNSGLCGSSQGSLAGVPLGNTVQYTLNAGQVVHFWNGQTGSPTASANNGIQAGAVAYLYKDDFTGSVVTSSKPVAVFGGSDCTFKPFGQYACDHIEEEMFPFSTWGKRYVGVKSKQYAGTTSAAPDYWRIVAACGPSTCQSGTTVTITPAINNNTARAAASCGSACTCTTSGSTTTCKLPPLASGQTAPWIEFQHSSSFVATSDQPLNLAQYFTSESASGNNTTEGDPSLVLVPPVEQWRTDYTVLAPTTYAHNYVNLTVDDPSHATSPATASVTVDGAALPAAEWSNIPGTTLYAAVHALSNSGTGSHPIATSNGVKVGVVVYGYDSYVSYGYTGGLDLKAITQIIPGG